MNEPDWSQYEAHVGKRWDYYRPRFESFARGKWLSWNWAAFFGTLAWLRYRKLYAWSWVYFFFSTPFLLASLIVVYAAGDACERALDPASRIIDFTILSLLALGWIVPPLVANRLYFNRVRAIVAKSTKVTPTGGYAGALALQVIVLCSAVVMSSSGGDFTYRAMVTEGYSLAKEATLPVEEYVINHDRFPGRIEEVFGTTSGKYVDRLVLETDGTIRAIFGNNGRKLSGHSLSFSPVKKKGEDGFMVGWVCHSTDLPDKCLPLSCRASD